MDVSDSFAIFVPSALLMQIGIRVFLGPTFPQMMICNAFWVPWRRLVRRGEAETQVGQLQPR